MRRGLSFIEITITVLIMAVAAAVVLPGWADMQVDTRLTAASAAVQADLLALQRHAAQTSTEHTLTVTNGSSVINVSPAVPSLLGDGLGNIDYGNRYPGVSFTGTNLDGSNSTTITLRGELVNSTDQRLSTGLIQITYAGTNRNIDVLNP